MAAFGVGENICKPYIPYGLNIRKYIRTQFSSKKKKKRIKNEQREWLSGLRTQLVSMRMWVGSLASLSS